jgi:osmotically-inducible protein OsmY
MMNVRNTGICLVLICLFLTSLAVAQKPALRIGFVEDGPWERDQMVRATLEKEIQAALGNTHDVQFPDSKRLSGNWTRAKAAKTLDWLLADKNVDAVITLGILSSYEAAKRKSLSKPVIAARVIAPDLLDIPSKQKGQQFVSGVKNLSYVTPVAIDFKQTVAFYRQIVPFQRVTFLAMEALEHLFPNLQADVEEELAELQLAKIEVILLKDQIGEALKQISPDTDAVILTPLPQLPPGDLEKLVAALRDMKLPSFSLGEREQIELGVLAGVTAKAEAELIAKRVASNLRQIVDGAKAEDLPVELGLEESLSVNTEAMAALGIQLGDPQGGAQQVEGGSAASQTPSMSAGELEKRQLELAQRVQRELYRLSSYSAFDAINFQIQRTSKVILLGYAFQPTTKESAERVVQTLEEVEEVENRIEVLPVSGNDDLIRAQTYAAIYGHPAMRRYVPGAGFSGADVDNFLRDLEYGLQAAQITRGPHNIHIIVKNGNVALVGVVGSDMHKQIAEHMARSIPGAFAVENYLQVVKSS